MKKSNVKRILIISEEFPPVVGGAGMMALELANALSTYEDKKIDVTIVTKYVEMRNTAKESYNLIEVRTIPRLSPYSFWKEIKKLNISDFDKIVINDLGAVLVASIFFNKRLREKSILFLHGSEPEFIFLRRSLSFILINLRRRYLRLLRESHRVIAVSNFMKNKLLRHCKCEEIENKIDVIYNGLNFNQFFPEPINLHILHHIPYDRELLLSVSRIVKNKGYDEKYQIFKLLIESGYKFQWIIIGEGNYLDTLKTKASNDGIEGFITFLGRIERDSLRKYYSSVDLFWLLSKYEESLGLVYIEAQLCGCPVMGKNKSGVKEAVNLNTGFLIDDKEQCIDIIKNHEYKNKSKSFENEFLSQFDMRQNIKQFVNLL